jgi:hypothetical protein
VKTLLEQFITPISEQNGNGVVVEDKEDNLASWILRKVIWDDIPECVTVGLKREGFIE